MYFEMWNLSFYFWWDGICSWSWLRSRGLRLCRTWWSARAKRWRPCRRCVRFQRICPLRCLKHTECVMNLDSHSEMIIFVSILTTFNWAALLSNSACTCPKPWNALIIYPCIEQLSLWLSIIHILILLVFGFSSFDAPVLEQASDRARDWHMEITFSRKKVIKIIYFNYLVFMWYFMYNV